MNRIYLATPHDDEEYAEIRRNLDEAGWTVVGSPEGDLRTQAGALVTCQAICMHQEWWTSVICHHLQLLAQGMRLPLIHPKTLKVLDAKP